MGNRVDLFNPLYDYLLSRDKDYRIGKDHKLCASMNFFRDAGEFMYWTLNPPDKGYVGYILLAGNKFYCYANDDIDGISLSPIEPHKEEKPLAYIAGALNSDAVGYIKNMHRMIKFAREVRRAGFSVYVPCNDFLEGLVDGNFAYEDFFDNSQPILCRSDVVAVTPGWEHSTGTGREIATANNKSIPVFYDMDSLINWKTTFNTKEA